MHHSSRVCCVQFRVYEIKMLNICLHSLERKIGIYIIYLFSTPIKPSSYAYSFENSCNSLCLHCLFQGVISLYRRATDRHHSISAACLPPNYRNIVSLLSNRSPGCWISTRSQLQPSLAWRTCSRINLLHPQKTPPTIWHSEGGTASACNVMPNSLLFSSSNKCPLN